MTTDNLDPKMSQRSAGPGSANLFVFGILETCQNLKSVRCWILIVCLEEDSKCHIERYSGLGR